MENTKITILGMSGTGKTCYLLGLYYRMGAGLNGFSLAADDDTDVQLRDRYARLCDATLEPAQRFPAGTDNTSKYTFDLQYGYNTIMSFDWIDYPGGSLDKKNKGNLEEYEDIKNTINKSSSLFICVDGSLLCGDDFEEKVDNVKDNCSNVINTFVKDYKQENKVLPPTAIIVTKYDLCMADTDAEQLKDIIKEAFSPFFVEDNSEKVVAIIPVSIGVNIMDNKCPGKLKPLNIHLPIFMGVWFALVKKMKMCEMLNKHKRKKVDAEIDKLRNQKARQENRWIFMKKKKIKKLAEEIQEEEKAGRALDQSTNTQLKTMQYNCDKLVEELKSIPYVYLDGKKSSFDEITG